MAEIRNLIHSNTFYRKVKYIIVIVSKMNLYNVITCVISVKYILTGYLDCVYI